ERGVDTVSLNQTRTRLKELGLRIRQTTEREDELREYRHFMRVEWGERKPRLVAREAELSSERQAVVAQREMLKQQFQSERREYQAAVTGLKQRRSIEQQLLESLVPLLTKLSGLSLEPSSEAR